jgi:hypothetical protein
MYGSESLLFYRPTAKKMYQAEFPKFENLEPGTIINCSFDKIVACDVSFADEFIINLQKHIKQFENVILRVSDCNEEVLENLQAALVVRNNKEKAEEKVNVLCFQDSRYMFIDKLENNLQQTFDYLQEVGELTAREVANKFELEINSASNRLKNLYNARKLFRKEVRNESGMQHVYFILK